MICEDVRAELLGYQLGAIAEDSRRRLEAHLPGCAACVTEWIELKRAIDDAEDAPRPSDAARRRLRAAVIAELAPAQRPRRWWERPAALVLAAAAVVAARVATEAMTTGSGDPPYAEQARE